MIKIGLTGGIGTGKSLVASVFEHLKVPVYHADDEAKKLLGDEEVISLLTRVFGAQILTPTGFIDRKVLAGRVFSNSRELMALNNVLHPRVRRDFEYWCSRFEDTPYVMQEAAILFESGFNSLFDKTILVDAPTELCIERVVQRDQVSPAQVMDRMKNQWDQEKKKGLADYILVNDGQSMVVPQVLEIHTRLLTLSGNGF